MNTALLLKVKAAILAEPLKFDMDSWFHKERVPQAVLKTKSHAP